LPVWNNDATATTGAIAEGIQLLCSKTICFKSEPEDQGHSVEQVDLLDWESGAKKLPALINLLWGDFGAELSLPHQMR